MNQGWTVLRWGHVCDQAPGVRQALDEASSQAEYGVNFFEFIHTTEGLEKHAQEWWDSLSADEQKTLLANRVKELKDALARAEEALAEVGNDHLEHELGEEP